MRHLFAILILIASLAPVADAAPTLKVDLGANRSFTLSVNPTHHPNSPEFMGFVIAHRANVVVETKGDPMLYVGGHFVGYWPAKHLTYVLKDGTRVVGHADGKQGNPQRFEIFHADGTATFIRKADTLKPEVRKLTAFQARVWRALYSKPTHELHEHEMK